MGTRTETSKASNDDRVKQDQVSRLRMAVLRVARRLRQQVHAGVTPSQLAALGTLDHRGPLTLGELAGFENVTSPTMSRIVAALEDDGYVTRSTDPSDRRLVLLDLTPKASRELQRIRRERSELLSRLLAKLDGPTRRQLLDSLDALEQLAIVDDDQ